MRTVFHTDDIERFENKRALVGVYLDHCYDHEKLQWLLDAKAGFDAHVGNCFELLILKKKECYQSSEFLAVNEYDVDHSNEFIRELGIRHEDLPCLMFRAKGDHQFYLKLGSKSKAAFLSEIGRLGDVALEAAEEGPDDPFKYREFVNVRAGNWLRKNELLSVSKQSITTVAAFLGIAANAMSLV